MIVLKDKDLCSYESFDKIDSVKISDGDIAKLKQKCKYSYYKFYDELIDSGKFNGKVLDFDLVSCLISSSDLNGGYITDDKIVKCLCFVNGKCVVITK